jgi:hypothetical protein
VIEAGEDCAGFPVHDLACPVNHVALLSDCIACRVQQSFDGMRLLISGRPKSGEPAASV